MIIHDMRESDQAQEGVGVGGAGYFCISAER